MRKLRSIKVVVVALVSAVVSAPAMAQAAPPPKCGVSVMDALSAFSGGTAVAVSWRTPDPLPSTWQLLVDDAPDFTSPVQTLTATSQSIVVAELSESTFYFRTQAKSGSGCTTSKVSDVVSTTMDATAPDVLGEATGPTSSGWFTGPVTVNWSGTDAGSGIASCESGSYSGPDGAAISLTGSCTDAVGNTGTGSIEIDYDASGPEVSGSAFGPGSGGWLNGPASIAWTGTDAASGVASCDSGSYQGPDGEGIAVSGTCTDVAGNVGTGSLTIDYDSTAPSISGGFDRAPDSGAWHRSPVSTVWSGSDELSGLYACTDSVTYEGPDGEAMLFGGLCSDVAGNFSTQEIFLNFDATAPTVVATADRLPDANGWYREPVLISFDGEDATSGLADCDGPVIYSGPSGQGIAITGSCRDAAGNVGTATIVIDYDSGLPEVSATPDRAPDKGIWYRSPVSVSFNGEDAISGIDLCSPSALFSGPDALAAIIGGSCTDRAGNVGYGSLTIAYDATAPVTTIDDLALPVTKRVIGEDLTGTATDNLSGIDKTYVEFTDVLGSTTVLDAWVQGDSWSISTRSLLQGYYTVRAWSEDLAGNRDEGESITVLVV